MPITGQRPGLIAAVKRAFSAKHGLLAGVPWALPRTGMIAAVGVGVWCVAL